MHEVLVNRLGGLSLPRKSVVRLTDRPDLTLDVYCGRKATMQQQQPPREREKEKEKCDWREEKISKQPPPTPMASTVGPCPTVVHISRMRTDTFSCYRFMDCD